MTDAIDPTKSEPIKPASNDYQLAAGNGGDGRKLGHLCCGGCCDMRRAVIIVNIINTVLLTLGLFGVVAARITSNNVDTSQLDDDSLQDAMEQFKALPLGGFLAIQTVKIVLCLAGIVGAVKYNQAAVGLAMVGYVFDAVMGAIRFDLVGLVCAGLFAYPHGFLIKEVRDGIMTKENYPNEEHSCCCV